MKKKKSSHKAKFALLGTNFTKIPFFTLRPKIPSIKGNSLQKYHHCRPFHFSIMLSKQRNHCIFLPISMRPWVFCVLISNGAAFVLILQFPLFIAHNAHYAHHNAHHT
uniref:Uncharacterized protein n=1 Tax=Cacopsylla melanoneura TaxID=428564 RepID=A0A8D8YLC8_9HEMI